MRHGSTASLQVSCRRETTIRFICTNLLECIHDWSVNIQSRNCTNVVYFDFKKSFRLRLSS